MAAKGSSKGLNGTRSSGSRIKFRFVDIEMENVDESFTEGLKSLANALSRGHVVTAPARQIAGTTHIASATGLAPEGERVVSLEEQVDEIVESQAIGPEAASNGKPKKKRTPKAPRFLSDIDLTTASVTLEDFMKEKSPSDLMGKYTVIAFWFKEYFNLEEVTVDHIFTAFKHLGWQSQMPDDPGQIFRNAKHLKNWFDKGAKGAYKINWSGQNAVNKMGAPRE